MFNYTKRQSKSLLKKKVFERGHPAKRQKIDSELVFYDYHQYDYHYNLPLTASL